MKNEFEFEIHYERKRAQMHIDADYIVELHSLIQTVRGAFEVLRWMIYAAATTGSWLATASLLLLPFATSIFYVYRYTRSDEMDNHYVNDEVHSLSLQ